MATQNSEGSMPSKAAVAVLTYHRITDQHSSGRLFHDVALPRFQSQMTLLARRMRQVDGPVHRLENGRSAVLTFDDGFAGHLMIGKLLQTLGLVGVFSVISGFLGKTGHLSARNVKELAALGHCIASHTVTHRPLLSLSAAQITDELGTSKAALEDLTGQPVDWLVPPGGLVCERSLGAAMELGFKVVRTMDWGYATLPLQGVIPCLPILSQYSSRRFEGMLDGHGMIWLFNLKRRLKRALGDRLYFMCRDFVGGRGIDKARAPNRQAGAD
jgi:peptidoglycan/xylan/chitin deacetylase (PgdA/CDA1 family)